MKRYIFAGILIAVLSQGLAFGAPQQEEFHKTFSEMTIPKNTVRIFIGELFPDLAAKGMRVQDMRVEPVIRTENYEEIPIELSLLLTEDQIKHVWQSINAFGTDDYRCLPPTMSIAATAETAHGGRPYLVLTLSTKILVSSVTYDDPIPKSNFEPIEKAFKNLLKNTTFAPQVKITSTNTPENNQDKSASANKKQQPTKKVWLTNFRLGYNYRVQITGYALDAVALIDFCRDIEKEQAFLNVWINNINRNTYEKVPVFKFDISGKLK